MLLKLHGDGKGKKALGAQPHTPREGPYVLVQALGAGLPRKLGHGHAAAGRLSPLGTSRGSLLVNKLRL